MTSQIQTWTPIIRDGLEALFYLVVGILTFLTYLQAKKTFFQPLKIEVFKEQLRLFTELSRHFTRKTEVQLRDEFNFNNLLWVNITRMYDDYARMFFDMDLNPDNRPYNHTNCPYSIFSAEHASKYLTVDDKDKQEAVQHAKSNPDPRVKATLWSKYVHAELHVTREYHDKEQEFRQIMDSPLLPKKVVALLENYLSVVEENQAEIAQLLTGISQQLPEKYQTEQDLKQAAFGWIHHEYNQRFKNLEPEARKISNYLRDYFTTDKIFE